MRTHKRFGVVAMAACLLAWTGWLGAEIPAGPDVPTIGDVEEQRIKMLGDYLVNAYDQLGPHHPSWDEPVRTYLRQVVIESINNSHADMPSNKQLAARGLELFLLGCESPTLLYQWAREADLAELTSLSTTFLPDIALTMIDRDYPPLLRMWATNRIRHHAFWPTSEVNIRERFHGMIVDAMVDYVRDKTFLPGDRDLHIEMVLDTLNAIPFKYKKSFYERIKDLKDIDPVTRDVLLGSYFTQAAWQARGSGWARDVKEKGWIGFEEGRKKAREHFTKAWELDPKSPIAAAEMITICLGSPKEVRLWFDRAVAARLDYRPAYDKLLWALRPRWGGSEEATYAFGLECKETGRYDTFVPSILLTAMWQLANDYHTNFSFWRKPGVYDHAKEAVDGILASGVNRTKKDNAASFLLGMAMRTGHWDDAQAMLQYLGPRIQPNWLGAAKILPRQARLATAAFTSKHKDQIRQALTLRNARKYDQAIELYQSLLKKCDDQLVKEYLLDSLTRTRWTRDYQAGQWVHLKPDAYLSGFIAQRGFWTPREDGSIIGRSSTDLPLILVNIHLGTAYEMKFDYTLIHHPAKAMLLYIKFGNLAWNDHSGGLRYKQSRDEIRSTYAEDSGSVTKKLKLKYYGQPNAFHLIRRGRIITLDVNNENVFKDQNMSEYYPLAAGSMRTVGFENRDVMYASSFKISNIYIRKLP